MKRLTGVLAIALALTAALPAAARAAVVLGSDLTNSPGAGDNGTCGTGCTLLPISGTPNPYRSPIDGVIVSWSSRGGGSGIGTAGNLRLRVMRNTTGTTFLAVRSGPTTTIADTGATHNIFTIPVSPGLAVSTGDFVGVDIIGTGTSVAQRAVAGFNYHTWQPPIADGVTAAATNTLTNFRETLLQVRIEPDADHDGFGDETQDRCPSNASTQGDCPVVAPTPTPTPTPNVQPAQAADTDHDGIVDASDRCPTVARGAFDSDNNGCPGPYKRIHAKLIGSWVVRDRGVMIDAMTFGPVPAGAQIRVRCGSCHVRQTLTAKRGTMSLKSLRGKLLKRGASFTATVSKPGYIGEQVTLTVKRYGHKFADRVRAARRPFARKTLCIPAGAGKAAKSCSATPATGP